MKTINHYLKTMAYVLSFFILLQGCTVYKSAPVSLEEASQMGKPVRLLTKNNEKLKYDRIINENGTYYTMKSERNADVITPIDAQQIKEIKVQDKTATGILAVGSLIAIPVVLFLIAIKIWPPAIDLGRINLD